MSDARSAEQDVGSMYARLAPEQRAAIARQFQDGFRQSGCPSALRYTTVDPEMAAAWQVAEMHLHARAEHQELFGTVMGHPIAVIALGDFATYEIETYVRHQKRGGGGGGEAQE